MTQPSEQPRTRPVAPHGLPSPDGRFLWDAERAAWVPKSTWREAAAPDPVASPRTHPEDYCGRCGGPNPSWHAASPLWNAVMRTGDQEPFNGIICPNCFAEMAAEQGVTAYVCLTTHDADIELPTVSPGGRLWDRDRCMWIEAAQPVPPAEALIRERDALADDEQAAYEAHAAALRLLAEVLDPPPDVRAYTDGDRLRFVMERIRRYLAATEGAFG